MDKAKIAKFGTKVAITAGIGLTLPMFAPIAAPYVATLMAGVLTKDLLEEIGSEGIKAIGGIFGNLAASHLWEAREAVAKTPENQDLLRLLANSYLDAVKDFEVSEEAREQANKLLPLVQNRIQTAIDTKKEADLLMLFPLDKNSQKGDLKYSFANRLTSEDVILQMADESFSEDDLLADEIEISIRRWYNEEKNTETNKETGYIMLGISTAEQIPEPLLSELREQLSKSIPKKIGELVKQPDFNNSWIAFQRLHLQALLTEVSNKQNGLSDEDRELLKPLAEKLDRLSKLEGVPEKIAELSGDVMIRFDNLETIIGGNQAALLKAITDSEERVVREVRGQSEEIKKQISEGNFSLEEIKAQLDNLLKRVEPLSDNSAVLQSLIEEIKNLRETANFAEQSLPNNIPPSIENFVGRDEYLTPLFEEYQKGTRCFVLHGIGGVGKTEIAKRFIEKIAGEYEAKVYVEMLGMNDNPYSAEKAMFEVVRQFEPNISADVSYEQLKGIFAQFVQQQKTLIFLDNAADKNAVEDLKQARACLIVTSREAFTLTDKDGGIHIGMMTAPDARNLLYEIAGEQRFAEGEADELAKLAGLLPMALRPIAALLAEDEFETAGKLINRYRDRQKFLEAKVPDYYDRTVAASFDLSYEKLSAEMQSRWRRLSVFPSEFDEAAIAAVLDISAEEADDTQKTLRRLSLLDGNAETRRFSLHDLVRVYTRAKLAADEKFQTEFLFAAHYVSILAHAQMMKENREENYYVKALRLIDTEWDNITAGQKWTTEFLDHDDLIAKLCIYYSGSARGFITLRLYRRTNIEWLEFGLKAGRKLKDRQSEGSSLGNLGNAYYRLGEYRKAIEYHEQYLEISREIGNRSGEGTSLGNLGLAYDRLGEYRKAIEYHGQSLEISREIGNRLGEGSSLGNLGLAYYSLGEYRKAIEYHEQVVEIFREIGDRLGEGSSLGNLGLAYYSLGEYRKAIEYHEQAVEISREIGDRLGEGSSLGNLGLAYYSLGEYRKAIEYHGQHLEISRETGNRLGEGGSLGNLGNAYNSLGEFFKAIEYQEQSLIFSREIGDRLGEGNSLGNLGNAYYNLGEKEKACGLWKEALAIFEAIEAPAANVVRQWIEEKCH